MEEAKKHCPPSLPSPKLLAVDVATRNVELIQDQGIKVNIYQRLTLFGWGKRKIYMGVSKNRGFSPQIIHFNRVFHYKPSILGYPYFWKHHKNPSNFNSGRVLKRNYHTYSLIALFFWWIELALANFPLANHHIMLRFIGPGETTPQLR